MYTFLVDVTNSTLTQINRINTWLTCYLPNNPTWGCPSANGSNNIRQVQGEDLKFWVQLKRDGSLTPPFSAEQHTFKDKKYQIHYEVEGPCA